MAFSAGTYSLPGAALNTGDTVSAIENNTLRNDMASSFNLTWLRDGSAAATANIPLGGFKLTGIGAATTTGDALSYGRTASVTDLTYTTTLTGGTGIVNLGSGQFYKDASGNVGIGTSSPNAKLHVNNASSGGASSYFTDSTTGTSSGFQVGLDSGHNAILNMQYNAQMLFSTNNSERMRLDSSGNLLVGTTTAVEKLTVSGSVAATGYVYPNTDNNYSTGLAGKRWSVVYAATGTINTSDAREKTSVAPLNSAELLAAQQLASEVGSYKWLAAIEEKGDAARKHIGMTVQRAIEIMEANGLSPFDYGFICYDEWADEFTEDGTQKQTAGNRYSFRMDELNLFIARGQQALITTLTERISALEAK
jgi:hypothetical protein